MLNKPTEEFILVVDRDPNTAYIHHKYVQLYTPYKDAYFTDSVSALKFMNENLPDDCFMLLLGYHLNYNYTAIDFIEDVERLYYKKDLKLPFKSVIVASALDDIVHQIDLNATKSLACLLPKPLIKDSLINLIENFNNSVHH